MPSQTSLSIVTPPKVTIQVLRDANSVGVPAVWLQPGTYDDEVLEYARENFKAAIGGPGGQGSEVDFSKAVKKRQLIIWLDRLDVHENLTFLNITVRLDEYIWDKSNGLFATKDDTARLWFTVARMDNILIDNLILVSEHLVLLVQKETKNKLGEEAEGSRLLYPFKLNEKDKHGDNEKRDMVSSGH
ncbi:uncharacterized protein ARB_06271 [Trichophyton benhamiae CBS 112371]|uniref:CoA-binding domain-containing protein n=2 Tax=Trichophyton TaxID=5550 RepID=D4APV3_ARTBC|nr:uncharacterized protein ARB_06271 [Trichophyton benhamiae CBS 112371]XP_003019602.1 uncharacterized protein TRV_06398 [Trichophyton verrucosum HKI 0517]EFE35314.1 hypothetical protein ARB_06271 [Trichophyton benhamiae CBS 112371]EFE38957.1 hypothetical protein TRV_06398 [Trichophyton verrucosum HKI 0517]